MKKTLVVARHNEDVSWLNEITGCDVEIVEKGRHVPNIGREASSYLWWMRENVGKYPEGMIYFLQGGSTEHRHNLVEYLNSPLAEFPFYWLPGPFWVTDGRRNPMFPDELPLPITELWEDLSGCGDFASCYYVPHALFGCSSALLRRKTVGSYGTAYKLLTEDYAVESTPLADTSFMQRGPWAMERLWEKWMTL